MTNPEVQKVKDIIDSLDDAQHLEIVGYLSVWSNGKKIRKFVGQGQDSVWHNPKNGFRKMIAILVEVEDNV